MKKDSFTRYYQKYGKEFGSEINKFYCSKEWKETRQLVYKRDCMVCNHCKRIVYKYPQCHHKIPITPSNINDWNITHNLDNIELLCVPCHNNVHQPERVPHKHKDLLKVNEDYDNNLF